MKKTPSIPQARLIEAIETIYKALDNSSMGNLNKVDLLHSLAKHLNMVTKELNLTRDEAWVFCLTIMNYVDNHSDTEIADMHRILTCNNLFALGLAPILQALESKGLLMSNRQMDSHDHSLFTAKYWPTMKIVNRIVFGTSYPEVVVAEETELLHYVFGLGQQMSKWRINQTNFYEQLEMLCVAHNHMPFINQLNRLPLAWEEKAAILFLMNAQLKGTGLNIDELNKMVFSGIRDRVNYGVSLRAQTATILKENYAFIRNEGPFDEVMIHLDIKGKELMGLIAPEFADAFDVMFTPSDVLRFIQPDQIRNVTLAFSSEIELEYERLTNMCAPENFQMIRQRLKQKDLKGGLTVLLSGEPGTGKTEMVKQLARKNELPLLQVEMSGIKGMYVGESERGIRSIFVQYAQFAERNHCTPILLLNEADALIGKRMPDLGKANPATVQMLNAMQNILLQELEDFEGILIATTNMPNMFDQAFARRFLHKLDVPRPNQQARQQIWAEKYPTFETSEVRQLAYFDLSGAEINNIAIRIAHQEILEGIEPAFSLVMKLLDSETTLPQERVMGFKMSA